MSHHLKPRLVLAVALTLVVGVGSAGAALASGDRSGSNIDRADATTLRFFALFDPATEFEIPADPDGPEEGGVGDVFVLSDVLFALDDSDRNRPRPAGAALGRTLIECRLIRIDASGEDGDILCAAALVIEDKGTIQVQLSAAFSEFEDPGYVSGAVIGGTGIYAGAGGELLVFDVPRDDGTEDSDSVYEVRL